MDDCLVQHDPLPKSLRELREFFGDDKTKPHGGRMFMDVRIAHTSDWSDIKKDARATLYANDITIWDKALQYPGTHRTAFLEGFPTTVDCHDWTN